MQMVTLLDKNSNHVVSRILLGLFGNAFWDSFFAFQQKSKNINKQLNLHKKHLLKSFTKQTYFVTRTEIPTQKSLRNSWGGKHFSIFNNETVRFVELMEVEYVNIA
jgi:hypothetical protein